MATEQLSLSLLSAFKLSRDGEMARGFESDKVRALLAYLAVEVHQPHRRERLAGLLWPEKGERKARRSLNQALYNLRHVIGPPADTLLEATAKTMQLRPGNGLDVDALAFEEAWEGIQRHRHAAAAACPECRERLATAVDLFRGEFLAGFNLPDSHPFEAWLLLMRQSYQRRTIDMLFTLARAHESAGDWTGALRQLRRILTLDSLQEPAYRQAIRVLVAGGRRDEAVVLYRRCRERLSEELGIEPDESTQMLYRQIRDGVAVTPPLEKGWVFADDRRRTAQLLETMARVTRNRGQYGEAGQQLARCLTLLEEMGDRPGQARILTVQGLNARDTGQFAAATERIEAARHIYLQLGDAMSVARANVALARLLTFTGAFADAITLIEEAVPVYRERGLMQDVAYLTVGLGLQRLLSGDYAQARTAVQRGLQISYDRQDQVTICFGTSVLGAAAVGERAYPKAARLLKQALVLSREIGRPEELGTVLACLSYIYIASDEIQRAVKHARDGLQLVEQSRNYMALLFIAPVVALLLRRQGREEQADAIFACCQRYPFFRQAVLLQSLFGPYLVPPDQPPAPANDINQLLKLLTDVPLN